MPHFRPLETTYVPRNDAIDPEYIGFRGVFEGEDGGQPRQTLDPELTDISDP
jgi:hypothetical protein